MIKVDTTRRDVVRVWAYVLRVEKRKLRGAMRIAENRPIIRKILDDMRAEAREAINAAV